MEAKKDSNSVASFLHHAIERKLKELPNVKYVIFLSDACGGLNKNISIVSFCSWLSRVYSVEVLHLFPVRGHSFGQCDRNFGLLRKKIKNIETMTTAKPYLTAMVECREHPSPFFVLMDRNIIKDWKEALKPLINNKPVSKGSPFKIQKYCMLKYKEDGTILASPTYNTAYIPFRIWMKSYTVTSLKEIQPKQVNYTSVSPQKEKDVRELFQFMDDESVSWLQNMLENS